MFDEENVVGTESIDRVTRDSDYGDVVLIETIALTLIMIANLSRRSLRS